MLEIVALVDVEEAFWTRGDCASETNSKNRKFSIKPQSYGILPAVELSSLELPHSSGIAGSELFATLIFVFNSSTNFLSALLWFGVLFDIISDPIFQAAHFYIRVEGYFLRGECLCQNRRN